MRRQLRCTCGWEFWADTDSPGQALPCPDCGKPVSGEQSDVAPSPAEPAAPPPVSPPAPIPAGPIYGASMQTGPARSQGLAVGSLVCGILSLIACPMCLPLAPVGLILATVATAMGLISILKKRGGYGMALAGTITGGAGLLLSLVTVAFFAWAFLVAGPRSATVHQGPSTMPTAVAWPAAPSSSGAPKRAPVVLPGDVLIDAFSGPLDLPPDDAAAEANLDKALYFYRNKDRGTRYLAECVRSFRGHLARAGLAEPAAAEHRKMFHTACDELVDRLLVDYRQAGQLEGEGKWQEAREAYDRILVVYLLAADSAVEKNIREHVEWCAYKRAEAEGSTTGFDDEKGS